MTIQNQQTGTGAPWSFFFIPLTVAALTAYAVLTPAPVNTDGGRTVFHATSTETITDILAPTTAVNRDENYFSIQACDVDCVDNGASL